MSKNWFCNRGLSPITQHPRDEEKDKTSETVITDSRKVSSVVKQNSDHSDCNSVISSTSPRYAVHPHHHQYPVYQKMFIAVTCARTLSTTLPRITRA
ncbi:unnamed protein product [Acanthoscelides obtectus]|uniref:Uncharacterized protein n=1 Tax=Acanthoscelides obtectus TaxID=200917 RepID=A0A9P0LNQ8_ACAOB|nr:unnamed protein product [Acanthoscelides obtectus]CAK1667764.1 hypothetical protein AOBTE_LOCUS26027 [Acanthoscelides obtectus]